MDSCEHLSKLAGQAKARMNNAAGYAGDVYAAEAYAYLYEHTANLVDVRTAPEWKFAGTPDISATPSHMHLIAWVNYPEMEANPAFLGTLRSAVPDTEAPVFFMCKIGGRSSQAASAATQAGYRYAFNILHGFEGDHNQRRQRGTVNGWKAEELPWTQA